MKNNLVSIGLTVLVGVMVGCADPGVETRELGVRPVGVTPTPAASVVVKNGGAFALLAGADGTITTLDRYGNNNPHAGVNSIDVGTVGGAAVFHQLDYLTPNVSGGWVQVYRVKDAGLCSDWEPADLYYNGMKIAVETLFYGSDGAYLGWHKAAYQHVEPGATLNGWYRWNNAVAEVPAWGDADYVLGNGKLGGVPVGRVTTISSAKTNGPTGGLCTDGTHLHQEGAGSRAPQRVRGHAVQARHSDLQVFQPAGGAPSGGTPPFDPAPQRPGFPGGEEPPPPGPAEPPAEEPTPPAGEEPPPPAAEEPPPPAGEEPPPAGEEPPPPGEEPPPAAEEPPPPPGAQDPPPPAEEPAPSADACAELGFNGRCETGILTWCENGVQRWFDCVASGLGCAWQNDASGFNCVPGCGDLDYRGVCQGASLRWCEAGALRTHDCAADGRRCEFQDDAVGFNCVR